MSKHIAVDVGASSGRVLVIEFNDKLIMDEIHRFDIEIIKDKGERLNVVKVVEDIKAGIKKATQKHKKIKSIGIDTWAVDTVPLNKQGELVTLPMFYRDQSFVNALVDYKSKNDLYELYKATGIQIQPFNTIFQMEVAEINYNLKDVDKFLMLPDFIAFSLGGDMSFEFTNATATQCFDLRTNKLLCKNSDKFLNQTDNRKLGTLNDDLSNGQEIDIISVATHDTASAILAIPNIKDNSAFLSSGTWSLLGKHVTTPITNRKAFDFNYSNEGNYNHTYRFQKNIMGLWLIVRYAEENGVTDFAKLNELARTSNNDSILDINDDTFLNPESMTEAIKSYCISTNQFEPIAVADFARVIYRSLAYSYKVAIDELEIASGSLIDSLTIVGGGAKAAFLNEEINKVLIQKVKLFPYESSALGNAIVQAIELGEFSSLENAHQYIAQKLEVYDLEK